MHICSRRSILYHNVSRFAHLRQLLKRSIPAALPATGSGVSGRVSHGPGGVRCCENRSSPRCFLICGGSFCLVNSARELFEGSNTTVLRWRFLALRYDGVGSPMCDGMSDTCTAMKSTELRKCNNFMCTGNSMPVLHTHSHHVRLSGISSDNK